MHYLTTTTNAATVEKETSIVNRETLVGYGLPVSGYRRPETGDLQLLMLVITIAIASTVAKAQDVLIGLTSNGGPDGKGTAFSIKSTGANFALMQTFADWGKTPSEDLVLGSDGNFYGTASTGGLYNNGTIFKVTPAGAVTVIYNFSTAVDGGTPYGTLTKGSDGNLYGLTSTGGTHGGGTIFKITPTGTYTVLRHLTASTDGGAPQGHLVLAKDGNFYGITYNGGATGGGTIFKITRTGTFTVLRSLTKASDGSNSYGSFVEGTDGNFYGMMNIGGTTGLGTIFKITPTGTYTVLRNLTELTDGKYPRGDLMQASDGNFYGMITYGGANGAGTIFKITSAGSFTVLRHLSAAADGDYPYGNLYQNSDGYLYGMLSRGGPGGNGSIFKIATSGASFSVLHFLSLSADGAYPLGGLIKGGDGNLYGMTSEGGNNLFGTVFKISTTGTFNVIANLNGATHGSVPYESLVQGKDYGFYGTTSIGGAYNYGTVFKICGGAITTLHSFDLSADGGTLKGSLLLASDSNFYGMTSAGGSNGAGTIFKITPAGNFTVLKNLQSTTDGGTPLGSLIEAKDGYLYGMTSAGGTYAGGTIFKISTTGAFTVLKHFSPNTDGGYPEGDLVEGSDGFLYGMNKTRIFKISTAGVYAVLKTLSAGTDGSNPLGNLVAGSDGNFYGMASGGGTSNAGTIFKITPAGNFTTLTNLHPDTTGSVPKGSLVRGSDGNFYGMTSAGGSLKAGTIFKVTPAGNLTVLRNLSLATDGGSPFGSLIVQKNLVLVANAQSITTNEDTAKAITLTGSGASPLVYTIITPPKKGKLTGTAPNITYKPNANFYGKDSFYFTVSYGCVTSPPAKVSVKVNSINDAPVLAPIGDKSVVVNNNLSFTATATDVDKSSVLTYSLIGAPAGASIGGTSGVFSWTPTATGSFSFTVRVTDNGVPNLYDEEKITITVTQGFNAMIEGLPETHATIFPNPVRDHFKVSMPQQIGNVVLKIVDAAGNILSSYKYNGSNNVIEVDASRLTAGTYVLVIESERGKESLKFVKL